MKVDFMCILQILLILFLNVSIMVLDYLYLFYLILVPHPPQLRSLGSSETKYASGIMVFFVCLMLFALLGRRGEDVVWFQLCMPSKPISTLTPLDNSPLRFPVLVLS